MNTSNICSDNGILAFDYYLVVSFQRCYKMYSYLLVHRIRCDAELSDMTISTTYGSFCLICPRNQQ